MSVTAARGFSPLIFSVILAAAVHGVFAWRNRDRRPDLDIIGPPPHTWARDALAFGDGQFLYRAWGLGLQNDGDTGGRTTRMKDYNYDYVVGWLKALQDLDPVANYHVFLAARYFSQTPNTEDVRKIVDFIASDVDRSPAAKWYWLSQVADMAEMKLHDLPLALQFAERLASTDSPDAPSWIWSLPAILLEKMQRYDEARASIEKVEHDKAAFLTPADKVWIGHFKERLK